MTIDKYNLTDICAVEPHSRVNRWTVVYYGVNGDQFTLPGTFSKVDAEAIARRLALLTYSWIDDAEKRTVTS